MPQEFLFATMVNNGQAWFASTRILAPRSRYDEVVDSVTALLAGLTVGDPLDPATQVGPLASERQRERVEGYIATGRAEGSRVTTGGGRPAHLRRGWYVEPTVFADVDNRQVIAREEARGRPAGADRQLRHQPLHVRPHRPLRRGQVQRLRPRAGSRRALGAGPPISPAATSGGGRGLRQGAPAHPTCVSGGATTGG